jgi:hypothetical protein
MKIIGKPYSGKLNVRFDEGELEIEPSGYYASSLLYCDKALITSRGTSAPCSIVAFSSLIS